jgi:DNA-binding NarL/FixJ family response regulator
MKAMAMSETARSFLQSAIESVVARKPFDLETAVADPATGRAHLTPRQLDVLRLICQGMTNKDIGRVLDIGNATVKIHVSSILRSLNVTSRLQAAIVARRLGLVEEQGNADAGKPERHPVVLRVVWDGASAQIIGIDKETVY